MEETTSACFEIKRMEYEYTTEIHGYLNHQLVWLTSSATQSAYCYGDRYGIIAKFRVKELKEQIGLL